MIDVYTGTVNCYWLVSFPAWFIILITAVARLNDIKRTQKSKRWIVRRLALIGAVAACVVNLAKPFTLTTFVTPQATWVMPLIAWSWALQLMTTPNMPPWWRYMKGECLHLLEDDLEGARHA